MRNLRTRREELPSLRRITQFAPALATLKVKMMLWRSSLLSAFLSSRLIFGTCVVVGALMFDLEIAHGDWQLAWSDEFNGSSINTNNWTFDIDVTSLFRAM